MVNNGPYAALEYGMTSVGLRRPTRETNMLVRYIRSAIRHAEYKKLDNGTWFAEIPGFQGVWANAPTVEECRSDLEEVLGEWLLLKVRDGDQRRGDDEQRRSHAARVGEHHRKTGAESPQEEGTHVVDDRIHLVLDICFAHGVNEKPGDDEAEERRRDKRDLVGQ